MTDLKVHPLAALFPAMPNDQFAALVDDVRRNGVLEPITTFEGQILDGAHRHRAAWEAGVALDEFINFRAYDGDDPLGFVVSMNLARRHLDTAQRARIAAKLAKTGHGGDRRSDQVANLPPVTHAKAAERLHVSERSVQAAKVVEEHGTGALKEALDHGEIKLHVAERIARMPEHRQAHAIEVNKGPKAKPMNQPALDLDAAVRRFLASGFKDRLCEMDIRWRRALRDRLEEVGTLLGVGDL